MAKWEYATFWWDTEEITTNAGAWEYTYRFGFTGPDGKYQALHDIKVVQYLNELGADGWEVFEIVTSNGSFPAQAPGWIYQKARMLEQTYWLKRQVTN